MFPFPENYVPLEVTNKLTLTSQQWSVHIQLVSVILNNP